jgi:riboflavin kinase/FMN adenylyltransferase
VVITYWPHPRLVLGQPPPTPSCWSCSCINTLDERICKLADSGVTTCSIVPLPGICAVDSEDYIQNLLLKTGGRQQLVIGYDHAFGKNREGGFDYLQPARRPATA